MPIGRTAAAHRPRGLDAQMRPPRVPWAGQKEGCGRMGEGERGAAARRARLKSPCAKFGGARAVDAWRNQACSSHSSASRDADWPVGRGGRGGGRLVWRGRVEGAPSGGGGALTMGRRDGAHGGWADAPHGLRCSLPTSSHGWAGVQATGPGGRRRSTHWPAPPRRGRTPYRSDLLAAGSAEARCQPGHPFGR